jgi:ribosomal protein S9
MAELRLQAAEKEAKARVVLAEAAAKEIEVGGKVKQSEQVLAEIKARRDVEVAQALAQIRVPTTVIGGGPDGKGVDLTGQMISYQLLKASGLLAPEPPAAAVRAAAK